MNTLGQFLAVGLAGFFGAISRYALSIFCGRWFGPGFPVGTMVINLSGSFFLGWFATAAGDRFAISPTMRLAISVGFVGAYTTFSTLMFDSTVLFKDGATLKAMFNLVGSFALGLIAVWSGMQLAAK